jgi:HEPN domain-containing protein/predicted nucleotidyltransferase
MLTPRLRARINKIVRALKPYDPEQVILFGSAARGDADRYSDIDIAIIKETNERFLDRLAQVYRLIQPDFALDALVYTPSEFAAMRARHNPFAEEIVRDGIIVYDRLHGTQTKRLAPGSPRMKRTRAEQEGLRWLKQARVDLETAKWNEKGNFHAAACFWAQQTAERALKAFLYFHDQSRLTHHSIVKLAKACARLDKDFAPFVQTANTLDRYYIPTRYPNGLPEGIPAQTYSATEAQTAIQSAEELVNLVASKISQTSAKAQANE